MSWLRQSKLQACNRSEQMAHRGATVRPVMVKFIRNLYDVREALEGLLVEACAANASSREIAELQILRDAWEKAAETGDTSSTLIANRRLHDRINQIGDNEEAKVLLSGGWPLINAFRLQIRFGDDRIHEIRNQHRALVAAIAAHDSVLARQVSREHCWSARDDLIRKLEVAGNVSVSLARRRG